LFPDVEEVFRALADPSRRELLDRLFAEDGQTLTALARGIDMTRFGVMKHLAVLEEAGLVATRRAGREKFHYLNPVPIRMVYERWVSRFAEPWTGAMTGLKRTLEGEMEKPKHVYEVYIRATPERVWQGLTDPELTRRYFHGVRVDSTLRVGEPFIQWMEDGRKAVDGLVLECDPPRRLSVQWHFEYDPELADDPPSRVTFEVEPLGETTRLRVVHDGFETETGTYRRISQGWAPLLNSLKSLLETGEPLAIGETSGVAG
jgi:uncharacterized protein YndB with AHSA1/START domain